MKPKDMKSRNTTEQPAIKYKHIEEKTHNMRA